MRITDYQLSCIRTESLRFFGRSARVWLFGSRVDDHQKGGDIDLYIEPAIQDAAAIVDAKLHFLSEVHRQLGEQKIDVVLRRASCKKDLPVYRIAKETGKKIL